MKMLLASRDTTTASSVQTTQLCQLAVINILKRNLAEEPKETLLAWHESHAPGGLMLAADKERIGKQSKDNMVFTEEKRTKALEDVEETKKKVQSRRDV